MKRIRVLIVETSSTTRQTLSRLLKCDQELEIVGTAASGLFALDQLKEACPDVVLLGIAMPSMEGMKTLVALREARPTVPILIFSPLTERGSQTAVDALLSGASGYVKMPESNVELERCVLGDVTAKIKSLGSALPVEKLDRREKDSTHIARTAIKGSPVASPQTERSDSGHRVTARAEIVVIAASTGGPDALASVLSSLPASFVTPIVVVQHMAKAFTTKLAESLRRQTGLNVREADVAQPLHAASVWIAPGGRHLTVTVRGGVTHVAPVSGPPENECCPSADVLFRSAVDIFGSNCLAVVLTGMGCDGLAGSRIIRQAGGTVIIQDEATSVVWGMPGQVAAAGLAHEVVPLTDLSREICRLVKNVPAGRRGRTDETA